MAIIMHNKIQVNNKSEKLLFFPTLFNNKILTLYKPNKQNETLFESSIKLVGLFGKTYTKTTTIKAIGNKKNNFTNKTYSEVIVALNTLAIEKSKRINKIIIKNKSEDLAAKELKEYEDYINASNNDITITVKTNRELIELLLPLSNSKTTCNSYEIKKCLRKINEQIYHAEIEKDYGRFYHLNKKNERYKFKLLKSLRIERGVTTFTIDTQAFNALFNVITTSIPVKLSDIRHMQRETKQSGYGAVRLLVNICYYNFKNTKEVKKFKKSISSLLKDSGFSSSSGNFIHSRKVFKSIFSFCCSYIFKTIVKVSKQYYDYYSRTKEFKKILKIKNAWRYVLNFSPHHT